MSGHDADRLAPMFAACRAQGRIAEQLRVVDGYAQGRGVDDRAAVVGYGVVQPLLAGEYLCPDVARRAFLCGAAAACGQKGHEGEKCCCSHVALFFKFQSFPFDDSALPGEGFYRYFRPAKEKEDGEWLSPAEILEDIKKSSAIPLSNKRVSVFGRVLRKHEIPSKRVHRGTVYHVVRVL